MLYWRKYEKKAILFMMVCALFISGCGNNTNNPSNGGTTEVTTSTTQTAENPFKKYKDKGVELYSDWYYLNARDIKIFNKYRLEYLETMHGEGRKNIKSYPIKESANRYELDTQASSASWKYEGAMKNDMPTGYGDIYVDGRKYISGHFTDGVIDSYYILYKYYDDGRPAGIVEADLSGSDSTDKTLTGLLAVPNFGKKLDAAPRIIYDSGNDTIVISKNHLVRLNEKMRISYRLDFDNNQAVHTFYNYDSEGKGYRSAVLTESKDKYFTYSWDPMELTEYYPSEKVKFKGTGKINTYASSYGFNSTIDYTREQGKQLKEDGSVISETSK